MALLDIVTYPDPILRKSADPVSEVTDEVKTLVSDMAETMYANIGVGLAAPQVGRSDRIVVVDLQQDGSEGPIRDGDDDEATRAEGLIVLINPEIVHEKGSVCWEEGCLSVPDLRVDVERSAEILIKGLDREGRPVELLAEDLLAVALQHEIDHLDGKLIVDKVSRLKRELYTKKMRRRKEENRT